MNCIKLSTKRDPDEFRKNLSPENQKRFDEGIEKFAKIIDNAALELCRNMINGKARK